MTIYGRIRTVESGEVRSVTAEGADYDAAYAELTKQIGEGEKLLHVSQWPAGGD